MAEPLLDALLNGLLLSANHPYRTALMQQPACSAAETGRALDAIHARPDHPFTTVELADIAGVTVPSLEKGFRRHTAMAPMDYVRSVRLARAHDDLRREDPDTTSVGQVARGWGFPDEETFTAAYADEFGESPWATLSHRPGVG